MSVSPVVPTFELGFPGISTQKILHYLSRVGGQLQFCQNRNRNFRRITRCLCSLSWSCPLPLQKLREAPYVKLTCFFTLWQTLAGIPYPLSFPLHPPFLFPTFHFLREAYWSCPWNDTVLLSNVGDVSTSDEQGDLGQSRVKLVLNYFVQSKNKTKTYIEHLSAWKYARWRRCKVNKIRSFYGALSLVTSMAWKQTILEIQWSAVLG